MSLNCCRCPFQSTVQTQLASFSVSLLAQNKLAWILLCCLQTSREELVKDVEELKAKVGR